MDNFCYLGDTISKQGGAGAAVTSRVRSGWKKFKELAPFLTAKNISLTVKGHVYDSCVRATMIYGSETWPVRMEDEMKIERNDRRMIRWICGVKLADKVKSDELRRRLRIEDIKSVLRRRRLRWFGHVQRKQDDEWVKKCMEFKVEGSRSRGRPKKSWMEVIGNDMKKLGLKKEDALQRSIWRREINKGRPFCQNRLTQVVLDK